MSTNESGPPDDDCGAGPAYGGSPIPGFYRLTREPGDIPIFTLNEVIDIMDKALEKLVPVNHRAKHSAFYDFQKEVRNRMTDILSEEINTYHRNNPRNSPR